MTESRTESFVIRKPGLDDGKVASGQQSPVVYALLPLASERTS